MFRMTGALLLSAAIALLTGPKLIAYLKELHFGQTIYELGPAPQPNMVVDHIDTNRCNNRPENLRWLTRIENTLNNDATRKKIIFLCGSIEAFIDNPSILRTKALSSDVSWMKTVTKEEAAACKKHIEEWALRQALSHL